MDLSREKTERKNFSVYPSTDKKIDDLAKKNNCSRSRIIEYLVITNYDKLMGKQVKDKKEVS